MRVLSRPLVSQIDKRMSSRLLKNKTPPVTYLIQMKEPWKK